MRLDLTETLCFKLSRGFGRGMGGLITILVEADVQVPY